MQIPYILIKTYLISITSPPIPNAVHRSPPQFLSILLFFSSMCGENYRRYETYEKSSGARIKNRARFDYS
jgi:hypothetical protein